MGLLSKALKLGGNLVSAGLNHVTGGAAGVLGNKALDFANKHSGVIGKVIGGIGRAALSDETRSKISNFAEKAIDVLPKGRIKSTLSSINSSSRNTSSTDSKPVTTTYTKYAKKPIESIPQPVINSNIDRGTYSRSRGRRRA
jgi:hypothetical protein